VVDISRAFDVSERTVFRIQNEAALARRGSGSGFRLSFEERVEIAIRVEAGQSDSEIARALGRHRSTVGREIGRCGGRRRYGAIRAEQRAVRYARRPKVGKLARCGRLLAAVEAGLERRWSPQQISARLKRDPPG
jgi:IS30 family transposase